MLKTFKEIEQEALLLEEEEQLELAARLIANVRGNPAPEIDEAWRLEIERRVRDIDEGRVQMLDGETVMRSARERLDEIRQLRHDQVLALAHFRRSPGYWIERVNSP